MGSPHGTQLNHTYLPIFSPYTHLPTLKLIWAPCGHAGWVKTSLKTFCGKQTA